MNDEIELIDAWERDGIACREIRSHRAPVRHTRLRAVACGVTVGAVLGLGAAMMDDGKTISQGAKSSRVEVRLPSMVVPRAPERVSRGIERAPFGMQPVSRQMTLRREWVLPSSESPTLCWGDVDGDVLNVGLDFPGDGRAVGAGVVAEVGRIDRFGLSIIVDHQDGTMAVYSGVRKSVVGIGEQVVAGQKISTGEFQFSVSLTSSVGSVADSLVNPVPWLNERVHREVECAKIDEDTTT